MSTTKVSGFISVLISVCFFSHPVRYNENRQNCKATLINDYNLVNAHIGISIFDPLSNKFLYDYQGEKYFVPASNTKIFSCYAGMKYLGEALPVSYIRKMIRRFICFQLLILPCFIKTILQHPVIDFLKRTPKSVYITNQFWKSEALAMDGHGMIIMNRIWLNAAPCLFTEI